MAETKKKKPASESLIPKSTKKAADTKTKKSEPKKSSSAATPKSTSASKPKTKKEPPAKEQNTAAAQQKEKRPIDENSILFNLLPYLLGFAAIFVACCIGFPQYTGLFSYITQALRFLFSYAVWAVPAFMLYGAIRLKKNMREGKTNQRFIFSIVTVIFISVLISLIFMLSSKQGNIASPFTNSVRYWADYSTGGFVGDLLGLGLSTIAGKGSIFIASFLVLIFLLFELGCTPEDIFVFIKDKIRAKIHDIKTKPKNEKLEKTKTSAVSETSDSPEKRVHTAYKVNRDLAYRLTKRNIDIDIDDKKPKKKTSVFDNIEPVSNDEDELEKKRIKAENLAQAKKDIDAISSGAKDSYIPDPVPFTEKENKSDLTFSEESVSAHPTDLSAIDDIFAEGAVIEAGGMAMTTSVLSKEIIDTADGSEIISDISDKESVDTGFEVSNGKLTIESRPTLEELYSYPDTALLKSDPNPTTFTVTEELKATAVKLVDTLANFGVKTKITNISCGPTVTRYELQPEVGVRVKAIQNLADDIALHLAANGVRIEAPIPGKDAVGIEIPNKTVSTVYIRNLIENPQFRNLKSKISVCLGMDVAGSPVYMDIAKMPHLLIAGATGMGKSVCINSFIISILYKARPDEVKFILIDPKKVEFSLYKGIPHLLVPVVNDPKKSAGALAWAVSEMERRFALIEEVGVRDIAGYNEATKNDPEKPKMSQIVIIIDELADLMMTARDEVESSICRLAQKARAAGMHIVIGTQRPSVDVITGLLKANIPSRIACTVASQVDSRTIIDIAGAEKLIGKGDMLFSPVGCLKPIRVQGSFVSDSEVEAVTDFLKKNFTAEYDKSIIDDIEREAAKCGEKKKGGKVDIDDSDAPSSGNLADSDEMIMPAIQVAISAGQLSTSLLQRKLSLGYARAARIVDILEQMGVVSGFEGSKPRRVLISEEQYLEMKMRQDSSDS